MSQTKPLGVFLGTGFSRSLFNTPSDNELIKLLLEDSVCAGHVQSFREELNRNQEFDLLLKKYKHLAASLFADEEKKLYKDRLWALLITYSYFIYHHFFKSPNYYLHEAVSVLHNFIKSMSAKSSFSDLQLLEFIQENIFFITTCTDMSIETVLNDMGKDLGRPVEYHYPGFDEGQHDERSVPIFKLHGSSNWFFTGEPEVLNTRLNLWQESNTALMSEHGYPQIILDNRQYYPVYNICYDRKNDELDSCPARVWCRKITASAERALNESQKLAFIGSGVPPSQYKIFTFIYDLSGTHGERRLKIQDLHASDFLEAVIKYACDHSKDQLNLNFFLEDPSELLDVNGYGRPYQFDQLMKIF